MSQTELCTCTDVAVPNLQSVYCNTPIGRDTTGNFSLSYKGVAVRSDCNRFIAFRGKWEQESAEAQNEASKVRVERAAELAKKAGEAEAERSAKANEAAKAARAGEREKAVEAAKAEAAATKRATEAAAAAQAAMAAIVGKLAPKLINVHLYDVTGMTLPGCDAMIYRVPVTHEHVHPGNLVMISDCPLQVLYVTEGPADEGGMLKGFTASGERATYIAPIQLGDCARYTRIISVLDICGMKSEELEELEEDEIAILAALLCCTPGNRGLAADFLSSDLANGIAGRLKVQIPMLLALQQSQCLESYILTRVLQGKIDEPPRLRDGR